MRVAITAVTPAAGGQNRKLSCMNNLFRIGLLLLLSAVPVALVSAKPEKVVPSAPGIDAALQPFVEQHKIAGAVVLVADKTRS